MRPRSAVVAWRLSLLAAVLGIGCAPAQLYPGPARSREEIAVVQVRLDMMDEADPQIEVVRIDGTPVTGVTWSVVPGPHTIQVQLDPPVFARGPATGRHYCTVRFEALAGHTYDVRPEPATTLGAWIREVETGARFPGEACTQGLPRD